jgi:LPS sulfotransferase NodH
MLLSPFRKVDFNPALYQKVLVKPVAKIRYVIYFTPRSGSSWLTDILARTKRLSLANEAFNPNFLPKMAQACNASNLEQYINVILRRHNHKGVHGFEITMHQLNAVFPSTDYFIEHFGSGPCFWLIREDVVAQAVSLAKMVTTKVAHTASATPEQRQAAEAAFKYDGALIKHWLRHIRVAEQKNETLFTQYGLTPLRISYEQVATLEADHAVSLISRHIGIGDLPPLPEEESRHSKLGTLQNSEFAERFRKENVAYMRDIDGERAMMLAQLDDVAALLEDPI